MSDIIAEDNTDGIDTVDATEKATKPKKPQAASGRRSAARRRLPEFRFPTATSWFHEQSLPKKPVGVCRAETFKRWRLPVTYMAASPTAP